MKNSQQTPGDNVSFQSKGSQKGSMSSSSSIKGEQQIPQKQQAGYSSAPEQQQIQQEQEDMHSERKLGNLEADREDAKPQEAEKPKGKIKK
jgi:hypothetical protein